MAAEMDTRSFGLQQHLSILLDAAAKELQVRPGDLLRGMVRFCLENRCDVRPEPLGRGLDQFHSFQEYLQARGYSKKSAQVNATLARRALREAGSLSGDDFDLWVSNVESRKIRNNRRLMGRLFGEFSGS